MDIYYSFTQNSIKHGQSFYPFFFFDSGEILRLEQVEDYVEQIFVWQVLGLAVCECDFSVCKSTHDTGIIPSVSVTGNGAGLKKENSIIYLPTSD